jgi:hypothetical protein
MRSNSSQLSIFTPARLALVAVLFGAMAVQSAQAFGGRGHGHSGVRFGVFVGAPLLTYSLYRPYYAPYYYYPPPYYPPVVVGPAAPTEYVEQSQAQPAPRSSPQAAPQTSWWYYCAESKTYYPYVQQCPAGWQQVAPQPPG